jgi:hypothetical protein
MNLGIKTNWRLFMLSEHLKHKVSTVRTTGNVFNYMKDRENNREFI